MALKTTWIEDDGIVTDHSKVRRLVPVEMRTEDGEVYDVQYRNVDTERITKEWVALTEAAAQAVVDNNAQPEGFGDYNYRMSEDKRTVGSYRLTREYTVETEGPLTSLDETANPTFDPNGGSMTAYPFNVTIESTTDGAVIRYATIIDGTLSAWTETDSPATATIATPPTGNAYVVAMAIRSGMLPSDTVTSSAFTDGS